MRLLFDENLSPKLATALHVEFPGSLHVYDVGLRAATDGRVWNYARDNGLTVVSKDDDFRQQSFAFGPPPKVVWLKIGNTGTRDIATTLREQADRIRRFGAEAESSLLIVSATPNRT